MKLTPENIAAIENFLTRRQEGKRTEDFAAELLPNHGKKSRYTVFRSFLVALRALGVDVPNPPRRGRVSISPADLAEFRAWKASRSAQSEQQQ